MSKFLSIARKTAPTLVGWVYVVGFVHNGWAFAAGYFGIVGLYALAAGLAELTPKRRQERAAVGYLTGIEAFAAQRAAERARGER